MIYYSFSLCRYFRGVFFLGGWGVVGCYSCYASLLSAVWGFVQWVFVCITITLWACSCFYELFSSTRDNLQGWQLDFPLLSVEVKM